MKDAAYSVAVNGYNRTDRGPFHATQRWFSRASPKGIRATDRTAPCKQGGVRRRVRRRYLSMDRLYSISRELLSGPFGHIFLSLSAFISDCTFLPS
jgi:hypothetical protein